MIPARGPQTLTIYTICVSLRADNRPWVRCGVDVAWAGAQGKHKTLAWCCCWCWSWWCWCWSWRCWCWRWCPFLSMTIHTVICLRVILCSWFVLQQTHGARWHKRIGSSGCSVARTSMWSCSTSIRSCLGHFVSFLFARPFSFAIF